MYIYMHTLHKHTYCIYGFAMLFVSNRQFTHEIK